MRHTITKVLLSLVFVQLSIVNCQKSSKFSGFTRSGLLDEPSESPTVNAQCSCNNTNDLEDTLRFQQGR